MRKSVKLLIVAFWVASGFAILASRQNASGDELVPYPEGFREWVHIKSVVIGEESPLHNKYGGMNHVYANSKAIDGFKKGTFPDGSMLVVDVQTAKTNAGVIFGGERRFIDVMYKDSTKFAKTGGWGFEEFSGDSTTERVLIAETAAKCFACHASQKASDYVFNKLRK